jgi:hypothetical protein
MPNYAELTGASGVIGAAARLAAAGNALDGDVSRIVSDIETAESAQPWGHDKYGHGFVAGYHAPVQGAGPLNDATKTSARPLGQDLADAGDAAMSAVIDYEAADAENAASIATVRDPAT